MKNFMTPIQELNININGNIIYMKRDDLIPFSFGGNKARKAVNFFAEIDAMGCDAVITYGSSSSNHCRIIANYAKEKGIKCCIISPEEDYEDTFNSKMISMFGAEIIKTPVTKVAETIDNTMNEYKKMYKPYFIQGGGHGNLGTKAYADAYEEIKEYERENDIEFDYIFHASGTGTTQAGLVAGKIISKDIQRKIVGISIARTSQRGRQVVIESVNSYIDDGKDYSDEVIFCDKYICGGYGKYNIQIVDTVKNVLCYSGVALNTTYTGKAFYGMECYLKENDIQNKNILFINTGGTPIFFDNMEVLQR